MTGNFGNDEKQLVQSEARYVLNQRNQSTLFLSTCSLCERQGTYFQTGEKVDSGQNGVHPNTIQHVSIIYWNILNISAMLIKSTGLFNNKILFTFTKYSHVQHLLVLLPGMINDNSI